MRSNDVEPRLATLDYLHSMLGQLRGMAEAERCDVLAYLIEMASVEAGDILRSERMRQGKGSRGSRVSQKSRTD